jgi:F420-dependent oxidoreductase-like protein
MKEVSMRIGIFGGTARGTIDAVVAAALQAEQDGFASYSLPQIFGFDAMGMLAIVGREVPRIELATFVVPTYSRHPLTMAQQALNVQATSGARFTLGIGLSHQMVIENMFGLSFEHPLRHMREYLSVLMPLLTDGKADFDGETISTHVGVDIDVDGLTPCPVIVAALGPKMLELAGTVTDGTATWMTGPATLESHTVPTITAAAERAGRPAPRVVASLPICVTSDVDSARERAAKDFQMYGFLPSYRAMLDREGAAGPADVALVGDEAAVTKGLSRMFDAGATEYVAAIYGSREERTETHALLKSLL